MTLSTLLGALLVKPALIVVAAAVINAGLRRHTAAARHAVWTAAVIATLALPLLSLALPPLRLPVPADFLSRSNLEAVGLREARTEAERGLPPSPDLSSDRAMNVGALLDAGARERRLFTVLGTLWLLGVIVLGARRAFAGARVRRIMRAARPVANRRVSSCVPIPRVSYASADHRVVSE